MENNAGELRSEEAIGQLFVKGKMGFVKNGENLKYIKSKVHKVESL